MLNKIMKCATALGIVLSLSSPALAQSTPPEPDQKKIDELKKALGSLNIDIKSIKNDTVVAKIGDKKFLAEEVAVAMQQTLSAAQQTMGPEFMKTLTPEILFLIAREQLIDLYLIQKAVDANKATYEKDPEVQEALELAKNRVFQEAYIKSKADEYVTKAKIREKYEEYSKLIPADAQEVRVRMILVKTEDEAKKTIEALDKGADFLKLARETSIDKKSAEQDGDMGYISEIRKATLLPGFEVLFENKSGKPTLPAGSYTKTAIKSPMGYHILKVEDRKPIKKPKLSEMEPVLKEFLREEAIIKTQEELRKKAGTIERLHPNTGKPMNSLEEELKAIQAKLTPEAAKPAE
ncbi:MAG: peptidylprolyl isomerase [Alphaproteobacteria bacterium]|nr:peptidylprolyl isomerase [Alphaproteobacteria bacterium]